MKTLLLLVSLLIAATSYAQQKPRHIDAYGFGGLDVNHIARVSSTVLMACGDGGILLRSVDNGTRWELVSTSIPDTVLFNRLNFTSTSVGICVGTDGSIARTSDAGLTWSMIESGTKENLMGIAFSSATRFVCVGSNGKALISIDAGRTWANTTTGTTASFNDVCRLPDGSLRAVGESGTLATLSPTTTVWNVSSGTSAKTFYSCLFTDALHGWVGTASGILRTENGGVTWTSQLSNVLGAIENFTSQLTGIVASGSTDGNIYVSVNSTTWQKVHVGDSAKIRAAALDPAGLTGVVVGEGGLIRTAVLATSSFVERGAYNAPFYFDHIITTDGVLWAVGSNGAVHSLATSGSWMKHTSGTTELLTGVAANADGSIICVCDVQGKIHRTADGGTTWTSITPSTTATLNAISFNGSFWAAGKGLVLRSTDGTTWTTAGNVGTRTLFDVEAIDANTAYVCGAQGYAAKTTDGGTTWTTIPTGTSVSLMDCDADATGHVVFVGQLGTMLETNDGGVTVTRVSSPATGVSHTAVDVDHTLGRIVVASIDGTVLVRGAATSQWRIIPTSIQYADVMLRGEKITAVGEGGSVMEMEVGPTSVDEQLPTMELPVYPNPTSTSFVVDCNSYPTAATISLIDVQGRVVVNGISIRDQSNVTVDVRTLPNGQYTLTLLSASGERITSATVMVQR
ncbi:MAG: T9SS type A sorting domain-containing protein [Candidatus Kapabacteria bacterium]|nr:T9SS type A sorting domain-containing protein [Candidatus Kapabacteria bacterium]